jgi:hypothetical protein
MIKLMIFKLTVLLLVTSLTGCFKQSPPEVQSDYVSGVNDQVRLDACSELDFNNDFLSHSNVNNLFLCTRWNEKFIDLYNGIRLMNPESWNYITRPISRSFFDDHDRRDLVIGYLKTLDQVGALDDLGHVLSGINEINFYTGLKELFLCVDGVSQSYCRGLNDLGIEAEDISNIGKLLIQSPEAIEGLARMVESLARASDARREPLRSAMSKVINDQDLKHKRISFLSDVLKKFRDGVSEQDINFVNRLFSTQNGGSFLYDFINSSTSTIDELEDLIFYFIKSDSSYLNDIVLLNEVLKEGIRCEGNSQNRYFEFSFGAEIDDFNKIIAQGEQRDVFDHLIDRALVLRAGEQFCPILNSVQAQLPIYTNGLGLRNSLSFIKLIERTGNYIENTTRYTLASFLSSIEPLENGHQASSSYLVSLLAGELSLGVHKINTSIVELSPELYKELLTVIMSLPRDFYDDLEVATSMLLTPNNIRNLKSTQKSYEFFNNEERSFVFNFMDRHFDDGINYVALYDFYSKMLYEYSEVVDDFSGAWFNENGFYSALRDFAVTFAGEDILRDFRLFYSREHIIEIIRVIANGAEIKAVAERERRYYRTADYIDISARTSRQFELMPSRIDLGLECLGGIASSSLYQVIENFPADCIILADKKLSVGFIQWLSIIQEQYSQKYNMNDAIFDENGIASPMLLGEYAAALAISSSNGILDRTLRDLIGHLVKERNSVGTIGHIYELEKLIDSVESVMELSPERSKYLRNGVLKSLGLQEAESVKNYLRLTSRMMKEYSSYLKTNHSNIVQRRDLGFFSCRRFLNQRIGFACPESSSHVVNTINRMIDYLFREYRGATSNLFGLIYDSIRADGGIKIPLGSSNADKYRLSLDETIRMIFGKTDKSKAINNLRIPYVERLGAEERLETMTTMERIEVVIRDVRFGRNYLGVQYMNYVAYGDDYNENVENRKQILSNCIVIPIVRCGKKMSRDERRQGENALKAFDGLLDANNGRGQDPSFTFGKFMQALLSVVVSSSSYEAQEVRLLPLSNEVLLQHNGVFLGLVTELAGFSSIGRWIQSRLYSNDLTVDEMRNSYGFKFVNNHLFKYVNHTEAKELLTKIIQSLASKGSSNKSAVSDIIEFIWNSDQSELLDLEEVFMKAIVISMHIGKIDNISDEVTGKYQSIGFSDVLEIVEVIVDTWPKIRSSLPVGYNLMEEALSFNQLVSFLYSGLSDESTREEYYTFLNESFLIVKELLLEKHLIGSDTRTPGFSGLNLVEEVLSSDTESRKLINTAILMSDYFDLQKSKMSEGYDWYVSLSSFIDNLLLDDRFIIDPYLSYLSHTTKEFICTEDIGCVTNVHYDFPYRVIRMSNEIDGGQSRLKNGVLKVENNLDEILNYLSDISRSLSLSNEIVR